MSTGLGLTFCKLAVEAHDGYIAVSNAPDKGSIFCFTIPLALEQVPESLQQMAQSNVQRAIREACTLPPIARVEALLLIAGEVLG